MAAAGLVGAEAAPSAVRTGPVVDGAIRTPAIGARASRVPSAVSLSVHLGSRTGPLDRELSGFDFHFGAARPAAIKSLRPHYVRVDASLEQLSPAPGTLRLARLQSRLAQLTRIGATPLVILDYTPAWLGQPIAPLGDRTKTEPANLNRWRELITRVAVALSRGPGRVRWFEAWNEPDLPTYWAGTQTAWLDTVAASAQGVHAAALRTGLRLRFGGPASFFPDSPQIAAFVSRLRSIGLPPAFVSWHYYANYPCVGPDGPENPGDPASVAVQRSLGCVNPSASPTFYTTGISIVRNAITSARGGLRPALILDEWNLSAGGLDRRMNTNVGAAFDEATLITFQQDHLDASAFYQATDTDRRAGGWGTVTLDGRRRPSWWAFRLWQSMAPLTAGVSGTDPSRGLWALASRSSSGRTVTVLLASFSVSSPTSRRILLRLLGLHRGRKRASITTIDAGHSGSQPPSRLRIARANTVTLTLPAQAVVLLRITTRRRRR